MVFTFGYSSYIGFNVYSVASKKMTLIKLNYLSKVGILYLSASKYRSEIAGSILKIVISHLQLAANLLLIGDYLSDDL